MKALLTYGHVAVRVLIGVIALIVLMAGWTRTAALNLQSVKISWTLSANSTPSAISVTLLRPQQDGCHTYLEFLLIVKDQRKADAAGSLSSIEQAQRCLTKQQAQLFMSLKSELLARLGRYVESCDMLSSIGDKTSLLMLTEAAFQRGDWPTTEIFLNCIENLKQQPGWIASGQVSDLYWNLGLHYEETEQIEQALRAYSQASAWYPLLPAPIIRKANILLRLGKQVDAAQLLLGALSKAVERPTIFALLVAAGSMWETEGELSYAYCAYQEAETLISALPASSGPDNLLADLKVSMDRLRQVQLSSTLDCSKLLSPWVIIPSR